MRAYITYPLIPLTISIILGISTATYVPFKIFSLILTLFLLLFIVNIFLFFKLRKSNRLNYLFVIFTSLLFFTMGNLLYFAHYEPIKQNHYIHKNYDFSNLFIEIEDVLKPNTYQNKYTANVIHKDNEKASGKILLYVPKNKFFLPSDVILINDDKLLPIPKNFNPYQFNYSKYLEKQQIFCQVIAEDSKIKHVSHTKSFKRYFYLIKQELKNSFNIHKFSNQTESVIYALLFGERFNLDQETLTNFTQAGVVHILAISGLHIGIIYSFLLLILNFIPEHRYFNIINFIVICATLWLFAFITGFSASVSRAVTLFSFLALGKLTNKDNNTINGLSVAALVLLCINPFMLFDLGFQLSFLAVLSIVLFQPIAYKIYKTKNKFLDYFYSLIWVSLAAQIGVLPLSLYYFNQFPTLFLVANILVIPLSTAILVLSVIILLLNFIFPFISIFFGRMVDFLISIMTYYIECIANIKNAVIFPISFSETLVILFYISIGSFIFMLYKKNVRAIYIFLLSIISFQLAYAYLIFNKSNHQECIIYNTKELLISVKDSKSTTFFTNNEEENKLSILHYNKGNFSKHYALRPLKNVFSYKTHKILIIDSLSIYKTSKKATHIVLVNNPKINLERVIKYHQPKIIIANKLNYNTNINKWEETCTKQKIQFIATAKTGFYKLE